MASHFQLYAGRCHIVTVILLAISVFLHNAILICGIKKGLRSNMCLRRVLIVFYANNKS